MDEQSLFLQALEQPAGEPRRRWLDQACADAAMRARIAGLVERHEKAGNFLDRPALEMLARVADSNSPEADESSRQSNPESTSEKRITKEKFIDRLVRSKLMTAEEVAESESAIESLRSASDAQAYAQAMVRAKKLTRFQARAIYEGRIKGLTFGEYVILDQLGKGGMGIVYKAQHRRMDRLVAIKVLPRFAMATKGAIDRFYREVKAAAKLMHSNIVAALDASEDDGLHYLVMEYVDGDDLGEVLQRTGPLPPGKAVDCIIQAARGLQFAHNQGVIHRDIKPANLLIDRNGTVKILDMGLARVAGAAEDVDPKDNGPESAVIAEAVSGATPHGFSETMSLENETAQVNDETRLTRAGEVMGTLDYMPPEQFTDTRAVDERGDIYSLGCTLYRLLTNERPFPVDTVGAIFNAHRRAPVPPLRLACAEVSPPLEAVFRKMLAKEPGQRQASMTQVIEELEAAISLDQSSNAAPVEPLPEESPENQLDQGAHANPGFAIANAPDAKPRDQFRPRRRKQNPWGAVAGVACALLVVGASTFALVWKGNQEKTRATARPIASVDSTGVSEDAEALRRRNAVSSGPLADPTPPSSKIDAANNKHSYEALEDERQFGTKREAGSDDAGAAEGLTGTSENGARGEFDDSRGASTIENAGDSVTDESVAAGKINVERGGLSGDAKFGGGFSFGAFGNRNVSFIDNGRKVSVSENDRGITVSIDGRVVTAADAKELKTKDREAFLLYEKSLGSPAFNGKSFKSPFVPSANDLQREQLERLLEKNSSNPQMKALIERMLCDAKKGSK